MRKIAFMLIGFTVLAIAVFAVTKVAVGDGMQLIRGNAPQMIYHLPECPSYYAVIMRKEEGDRLFKSQAEAEAAGFHKAKNCP